MTDDLLTDLDDVYPLAWLDGEEPPRTQRPLGMYDEHDRLLGFVTERDAIFKYLHRLAHPAVRWRSSTFYRAGEPLQVSTVLLAFDTNYQVGEPVKTWETMIFTGAGPLGFRRRYSTNAAALRGHRAITHAVRQAQRRRRMNRSVLAPSRSMVRYGDLAQVWFSGLVIRG